MGRGLGKKTLELRQTIITVLDEIEGSLSSRQLFYQCISRGACENTKADYGKVQRCVLDMRRDGVVPYDRIVDRTRRSHKKAGWDGPREIMKQAAVQYRRDLW